ncbi:MAG: M16 family metallopeptidase [Kiritimatiellia bacterium]
MTSPSLVMLRNRLRVVLVPCEAESVAFGLFIASGSRHETSETAGISHFIEHMLFKGTPTHSALDITRAIEGRGGNFNAYTGEEGTVFYAHLPCEYLAEAVDILSDMYLHATIAPEEFARERKVILEEIKMYADDPESVVAENLQRALFPDHPLGAPVAGSAASLMALRPEDLRAYIDSHYTTDRTVAVVVGRFDPKAALRLVETKFAHAPRARRPVSCPTRALLPPCAEVTATKDVQQTQLAIGYRMFGVTDPRKYAASVLDAILGRGMSSRLFQEVREKRGLSYDISSRAQLFSDAGMLTIAAGLDGAQAERTLQTIDREIARLRTRRVSAAELGRTKEFMLGNFRLSHERVLSKMSFYGSTALAFGRLVTPDEQVAGTQAVTAADVLAVAQDIFKPENRSLSWVKPR